MDRPKQPDETATHSWREAVLVGLLALVLNLAGNGRVGLWDRDEPRYAACAREMAASGDYIHPTFNGEPRYHKPVLIYWLMLGGMLMGGDNPFGARLVSSLAGAATCVLIWAWGQRMLGRRAGRLAALVLATAPIMVAESKLATTDAVLTFFVTGCQLALWELARRPSRTAAAVFWVLLGLAILTKSPAGPVLIIAAGAASWWFHGGAECWKRLHWRWGPALCALIVLPWNIAILVRSQGAYYDVAVGYHIVRRMSYGIEEHGGFPGYYLVTGLLTFYPWSALLPAAVAGAWLRRRLAPELGFLLGWILGPLVLLEFVRTKLIHYYLPAIPACALLVSWLVVALGERELGIRSWPLGRFSFRLLVGVGVGFVVVLGLGGVVAPAGMRLPCLVLGLTCLCAFAAAAGWLHAGQAEQASKILVVAMALVALLAGGWLLPAAEPYRLSRLLGHELAALEASQSATAVLGNFKPPGVVYALGHPAPIVRGRDGLVAEAERRGRLVAGLQPFELDVMRAMPAIQVSEVGSLRGFDIEKGRISQLHLVVITASPAAIATRAAQTITR